MQDKLDLLYSKKNTEGILSFFKREKLELLSSSYSLVIKIYDYLNSQKDYDSVLSIISSISAYGINVLNDELKDGLRVLVRNKQTEKCLLFLINHLKNNKKIDDYQTLEIIKQTFSVESAMSSIGKDIGDNCNSISNISSYVDCRSTAIHSESELYPQDKNTLSLVFSFFDSFSKKDDYSHNLWQSSINGYFKTFNYFQGLRLLEIYPFKLGYSELLWKKLLKENLSFFVKFMDTLVSKFHKRSSLEDIKSYEAAFNLTLELIPVHYYISTQMQSQMIRLDYDYVKSVFTSVVNTQLILKEKITEDFLLWMIDQFRDQFDKVECFILCGEFLTGKIIEKVIEKLYSVGNVEGVYKIICMCKTQSINTPFETVKIDKKILYEVFSLMSKSLRVNPNSSILSNLSQENSLYARSHFDYESNEQ